MSRLTLRIGMLAASVASVAVLCAPASMAADSWGWDQLRLKTVSPVKMAALKDALIASQPAGIVDARRQALALLVTSGTLNEADADLLAAVNKPSVVAALVAQGELTKAEGAAARQVIAGYSRTQARYSAAKYALELLTRTGVLDHAQAEEVRSQLVRIH